MATHSLHSDSAQATRALAFSDVVNDFDEMRSMIEAFDHLLHFAGEFEPAAYNAALFQNTIHSARAALEAVNAKAALFSEKYCRAVGPNVGPSRV